MADIGEEVTLGAARGMRSFGLLTQQFRGHDFFADVPGHAEQPRRGADFIEDDAPVVLHVHRAAVGAARAVAHADSIALLGERRRDRFTKHAPVLRQHQLLDVLDVEVPGGSAIAQSLDRILEP